MTSNERLNKMTMHERIEHLKEECAEYESKYIRMVADFQNYKRKKEAEIESIKEVASEKAILNILEFYDDLERACKYPSSVSDLSILKGSLDNALRHNSVTSYCSVGDDFDPDIHHGYSTEKCCNMQAGKVARVLKKGFKMNDKIIRYAVVSVSE